MFGCCTIFEAGDVLAVLVGHSTPGLEVALLPHPVVRPEVALRGLVALLATLVQGQGGFHRGRVLQRK